MPFPSPLCFFSICVMVINYIVWKEELKTVCCVVFVAFFFLNPVIFKDRQRKKHHRWDSKSIVPAHPEPDPKNSSFMPAGLSAVCLCEHQYLLLTHHSPPTPESFSQNKDCVFWGQRLILGLSFSVWAHFCLWASCHRCRVCTGHGKPKPKQRPGCLWAQK